MLQKTMPSRNVLSFTTRTTLQTMGDYIGTVAFGLYAEAAALSLLPCGPVQWTYTGADGKPDTEFQLEISLPVAGTPNASGAFRFHATEAFTCASFLHNGAWEGLYETYERAMDEVKESGETFRGVSREQYMYMDFEHPENNVTEVQLGLVNRQVR